MSTNDRSAPGFPLGYEHRERGTRRTFTYRLVAIAPYETSNGGKSALLTWEGTCAYCGMAFLQVTGRRPRDMVRVCERDRYLAPWRLTRVKEGPQ